MKPFDLTPFINCEALPTLPHQISRILDESGRASAMDYNIVQMIQFDPAIASRVLKVANSKLYGYSSQIGSLQQAAGLLGPSVIKNIILTTPILERFDGQDSQCKKQIDYVRLWKNSSAVAAIAGGLGSIFGGFETDACFTSGLLHNLGKLSFTLLRPRDFIQCEQAAKSSNLSLLTVEQNRLGVTHDDIRATLIAAWGLPKQFKIRNKQNEGGQGSIGTVVALASALANEWGFDDGIGVQEPVDLSALCARLGHSIQDVKASESELRNYASQVAGQILVG